MKVLITGGAGFIGSHLAEKLLKLGYEVRVLDNLSSGSLENLSQIMDEIEFVKGDCKNRRDVLDSMKDVEVVFHLAANPEVRLELCDPETCFRENVYATHVVLEAVRKSDVKVMAFTSSSTVYGDAKLIPTPENYPPEPISVYGSSKLVGPRSKHGVTYDFLQKLQRNPSELEILGDGTQRKSYLYVDDCINAMILGLQKANKQVEVFNVGSEDQITVKEIAEIVIGELGLKNVEFKFTGGVNGGRGWKEDVKNMLLDVSKLKSIGWKPNLNSAEAIKRTTEYLIPHYFNIKTC